jgi:VWFA-related protein
MLAAAILHAAASAQAPAQRVVDVVVQDTNGHPLHGLKPADFRLTDSDAPQTLSNVEEHSPQLPTHPAPTLTPLPPGIFTNYTPIAPGAPLNILLLDALNTTAKNQHFIRNQLQQYVEHANPNTRIAIFGLANRLILLQDFTSDPATLRDVIQRKLIARSPTAPGTSDRPTQPSAIEIAANLRQFESETGAMETLLRPQYTLDAFNTLTHYLAAFPGRKNLLWFSGSFPLNLLPTPSAAHPSDTSTTDQQELHETAALLSRAQVAIYPIDARGLMTQPLSDAAEHATVDALASSTGGHAIYNVSTLADAVTTAIAAGANYYTLTYTPTAPKDDSPYHPIQVEIAAPDAAQHPQLLYRRGYYTTTPSQPPTNPSANPSEPTSADGRTAAYKQAAMSRGAPLSEDIIFKVRALPASTTTETAVAPNNQLSAFVPSNGPFLRYDLDFLTLAAQLTLTPQAGHPTANVEFLAYVYDTDGRLLNATGTDLALEATTTDVAKLAHSVVRCHLEISVPDRMETFLRIGIRDLSTNKFGVVEVPASTISYLPPATGSAVPNPTPTLSSPARPATPPRD